MSGTVTWVRPGWYAGGMRYPDEAGLTADQRRRREEVRMRAVDLF
ncbi:hypothetical protein [Streptomyces sp. NPDC004675]